MESIPDDIQRLRCRLCFHAGSSAQLVEVFNKNLDLSKRILSALGVKINRGEKQARICTVCETVIDIIQSFQAVCKQTNRLYHKHVEFQLYDKFWNSQEQEAVNVTEKMILSHRSEVDKFMSKTTINSLKKETDAVVLPIAIPSVEVPAEVAKEQPSTEVFETEIVICEPPIKDEPLDSGSQIQFQSDLEVTVEGETAALPICDIESSDNDLKLEVDSFSEPDQEEGLINESHKPKKQGRKPKLVKSSSDKEGNENSSLVPHRRGRPRLKPIEDNDQSADEYEPKIPGKRGPRRKKVRKSDPSVCDICGQMVAYFVKESHHNQHLGIRPYKCDYEGCGRTYFSQNDLRTHSKRHKITYHVCEICGRNIKGVEWFRRHMKTHTEVPQFTCEVCGSKFRRKAQLQTHMVTHTGLTPHECETCGKRFALKYNLEAHVKRHQKKGVEKVQKNASEKRTWKYYTRSESSGPKHHVTCETCGKSVHKRDIEGHVNKHLERRPYSCDVPGCTLAFYALRGIKEHKMVVHSDKVLRYDCSICNRSIKGAGTFKRHVIMHNSAMKVECQHCGKKFTSKSYLKAHEQKHSGERPFVCDLCGRSFAMKPCWKTHMKNQHNQDYREPTRIRKLDTADEPKQAEPPTTVADNDANAVDSNSLTTPSLPLDSEDVQDSLPYHSQTSVSQRKEPQSQQEVPSISTSIQLYGTPEAVQIEYSY
ncbi:zinc finger protein 93 isoform X1 [Aedes albopictus]|uniref:C2h2-type zn-finger protein n=1 Tax=Aedes albopictus TaxID=7160 RepID=A0ABM1Z1P4_AEDAL